MTLRADITGVTSTLRSIGKKKATATQSIVEVLTQNGQIILKKSQPTSPSAPGHCTGRGGWW
jgi:hypothetical protein